MTKTTMPTSAGMASFSASLQENTATRTPTPAARAAIEVKVRLVRIPGGQRRHGHHRRIAAAAARNDGERDRGQSGTDEKRAADVGIAKESGCGEMRVITQFLHVQRLDTPLLHHHQSGIEKGRHQQEPDCGNFLIVSQPQSEQIKQSEGRSDGERNKADRTLAGDEGGDSVQTTAARAIRTGGLRQSARTYRPAKRRQPMSRAATIRIIPARKTMSLGTLKRSFPS